MIDMEVSGRKKYGDDEAEIEHICQPCKEENVRVEASGFCITCDESLCCTCFKYHRRPKPFKNHVLVDDKFIRSKGLLQPPPLQDKREHLEDIKHDEDDKYKTEKAIPPVEGNGESLKCQIHKENDIHKTEEIVESPSPPLPEKLKEYQTNCSVHRSEELKYHCRSHKKIVCSVCAMKEHKQCKNVDYIHEVYETERKRILSKFRYVEDKVAYIMKNEDNVEQISDTSYKKALSDIRAHRKQVNKYFDETEQRLHTECTSFLEDIRKRKTNLLEISQTLNQKEEFISSTNVGSKIERYISMVNQEHKVDIINRELTGVFGQPRLHVSYKSLHPLSDLGALVLEKQGNVGSQKLNLLKKINISRNGELCSISDITTPSNDSFPVILADCKNKRLIIISSKYSLKYYPLQSPPWGITYISDDKSTGEIAVTLPREDRVVFLIVGKEMSSSRRKSIVMKTPTAIRYHRPESALIVVEAPDELSSVQCWSLHGELMRTIASFNYYIDRMNLTTEERIIFTSTENRCLCLLDLTGKDLKVFNYLDDNMKGPYGLTSDHNQSIYVCGFKCLRMVSKEGKWDNILTSDDGFASQSLHICDKTGRLFVGQAPLKPMGSYFLIFQLIEMKRS